MKNPSVIIDVWLSIIQLFRSDLPLACLRRSNRTNNCWTIPTYSDARTHTPLILIHHVLALPNSPFHCINIDNGIVLNMPRFARRKDFTTRGIWGNLLMISARYHPSPPRPFHGRNTTSANTKSWTRSIYRRAFSALRQGIWMVLCISTRKNSILLEMWQADARGGPLRGAHQHEKQGVYALLRSGASFYRCENLMHIELCEGSTNIGNKCFSFRRNSECISIPSTVKIYLTKLSENVENWCTSRLELNQLESLRYLSCSHCTVPKWFRVPSTIKELNVSVFADCESLVDLELC